MLGNYGKLGWDLPEDDYVGNSVGKLSPEERLWRFRFRMDDAANNPLNAGEPVTHRILFLNGVPFTFWEHGLFSFGKCGHWTAMCLQKNNIDDRGCPICRSDKNEKYPYCIGMFGIIDLGQVEYLSNGEIELHHKSWFDKEGIEHENIFPRLLLGAKKGSNKNPGVLVKLLRQAQRKGNDLEGTIWDTTRSGDKETAIGSDWEYVDRIAPDKYVEYLSQYRDTSDLELDLSPIKNWREICVPLSYENLCRITGERDSSSRSIGAGYNDAGYNDDIPF